MKETRNEEMRRLYCLMAENESFTMAFNAHVDCLKKLTANDADFKEKYKLTTRIVEITIRHLKEDDIGKVERTECEVLLSFYRFLQALYESHINPNIRQDYIDRLAEIYDERRRSAELPIRHGFCDSFEERQSEYTDKGNLKLIKKYAI